MRLRKYGKKTVSVILACAMLGTSFAQYTFAEDAAETDVVVEQETQAAEVEEVGETQQESVTDAVDEFVADELSAEDAETAEDPADIADEQDGDGSDEISLTVTDIETASPTVTAYEEAPHTTQFVYEETEDGKIRILGFYPEYTDRTDLKIGSSINSKQVTEIATGAFKGQTFTGKLELPDSLEKIGANAFEGCMFAEDSQLKIPDGVTEIGDSAFKGCNFTGELKIPSKVTTIGTSVFEGCAGFTALNLQEGMTRIGESAFKGCTKLAGVLALPNSVEKIGASAFENCGGFTSLALPENENLETIEASAFSGCSFLNSVLLIPDSVTSIGNSAFKGCGFSTLMLSAELTSIGDSAFEGCTNLANALVLPTVMKSIGQRAFYNCSGLSGELGLDKINFASIGSMAFYNCRGLSGDLDLSNVTDLVGEKAFTGCSGLNGTLTLPEATSCVASDAIFTEISISSGNAGVELQVGDKLDLSDVFPVHAVGNGLRLDPSSIKWSVPDSDSKEIADVDSDYKTLKAGAEGTVTVRATAYNGSYAEKTVVVTSAGSKEKDNVAPTVQSARFAASVLKPGMLELTLGFRETDTGVKAVSGYFYMPTATAQRINFSVDWTTIEDKKPMFSQDNNSSMTLSVSVPSGISVGEYCLGGLTLTDMAGNGTTYTYGDDGTGEWSWKNAKGYKVSILVNEGSTEEYNKLIVKDGFSSNEGGIDLYITNPDVEDGLKKLVDAGANTTAIVRYDANNHTVPKAWFNAIAGKDVTLVLMNTDGTVAWCFYGKDIEEGSGKEIDCLVSVATADISIYGNAAAGVAAQFVAANKELPCKATVRVSAAYASGMAQQTGKLFQYSVNANNTLNKGGTPSYVLNDGKYWYEFEVTDNTISKILLSGKELSLTPSYKVTSITLSATSIAVAKGKKITLTATAGPVGAANKAVIWKSSNKKVAKVSASGVVTGKKYGTATITATAADGSGVVAKCTVRVGYKIKYKLNGGKNNAANPKAYYNQKVKLKTPTRPGYTFKGWYTDKNFKHSIKKIKKSYKKNLTLYAKWKKN